MWLVFALSVNDILPPPPPKKKSKTKQNKTKCVMESHITDFLAYTTWHA